ncbi:trypsin-like peptidase domain-containing protein [Chloracidobacterium sp. D]|uniref:Trypsin-like serine protease, typically periplasmic, contain C-terminal PDZ domain protein n=1 Tax=Chloracidobacterium thermophilum (strain B) TaxID=981222 RepID=G2LFT4_CHLTF|nr:trypsin-like peptidase domain-containing protein [Chloracidobacterium sp. D]AEP11728.1 Trypsin-like serine protease, typically periplasmic, contain C-terminal PDZ domain protein [Chloracidobacterium thermophilum B]QUV82639.1 trypsin-like peptidase domain-containing protein [Chloracidobacterium sp. D]
MPQLPNIADVVARTNGGVVNIQSVSEDGGTSIGSGFCLDAKGEIVTNFHVIRDALKIGGPILAVTQDGRILTASVRGYDEATDLALLEVDLGQQPLPTLPLGDSDAVRVGDWVIAIGSPFELDHTVTVGIISGKGRSGLDGAYDDFLQTDAAINFGNSGGPLVALTGEVIGINTLVLARGQGLGFAIPVNILKEILPDLRAMGRVRRSSIGVEAVDISALDRRGLGLTGAVRGVRVAKVERGLPGDQAGLRRGDIVVTVEGTPVMSSGHFNRLIARSRPGTAIQIRIRREEKEYTVAAIPIEKK